MRINDEMLGWKHLKQTYDGMFFAGHGDVKSITVSPDGRAQFVWFKNNNVFVTFPFSTVRVYYPMAQYCFQKPVKAVLMDLDGTSIKSEGFWIWVIEQTVARIKNDSSFKLSKDDIPYVSGFSVSEHLAYCIEKYKLMVTLEVARQHYFDIVHYEMREIIAGRGKQDAYTISPGLKKVLLTLKEKNIKIGLVTSGLYEKALPEILSGFKQMNCKEPVLGHPLNFYDAVITAGNAFRKGEAGTTGELCAKPHPWLYREICEVGLGIHEEDFSQVIVLEDSSAGVMAGRLAGFNVIGVRGGNIEAANMTGLVYKMVDNLEEALKYIL